MDHTELVHERTWKVNDKLEINKTYLVSEWTGKKIPDSVVYSVDEIDGENLNCFKTLKEARAFAKNYY